jgi:hypothetical protein
MCVHTYTFETGVLKPKTVSVLVTNSKVRIVLCGYWLFSYIGN